MLLAIDVCNTKTVSGSLTGKRWWSTRPAVHVLRCTADADRRRGKGLLSQSTIFKATDITGADRAPFEHSAIPVMSVALNTVL